MVGKHIGSLSDSVRSSGGDQTAHITVSYREGGDEITCIYALNEERVETPSHDTAWPCTLTAAAALSHTVRQSVGIVPAAG